MTADAKVQHRDKRVSRGMALLLGVWAPFCWALAGFIAYANATASKPVPAVALPFVVAGIAAMGLMFLVMALSFAVLRSVVTEKHLNVKYGLWGPEILLSSITACRVVEYDWTKFGGWGIRRGAGGAWAYVPGPGDVVEIEYDADGETKTVQIGAEDPRKLALEINRAREGATRLRIESDDAAAEEEMAALEEAEEEERRAGR